LSRSRILRFFAYVRLLATRSEAFNHPLIRAPIIERISVGGGTTLASSESGAQVRPSSPPVDQLGLQPEATPVRGYTLDASRHSMEPKHWEVAGMLTESASRPTTHSSVPHQRQDQPMVLADPALLALRNAETAVGLSSRADYVSKAGHALLSKGLASVKALRGDPTRGRMLVNRCRFNDPGSGTAVENPSGWRWEPTFPGSTERRS
jgi:hypothetical protein